MIASYLGWKTVVASGARDFHPGDIKTEEYLGECKTHMKPTDIITFKFDVWKKIQSEAVSVFKKPVLIADNGTQTADGPWCVISKRLTHCEHLKPVSVEGLKVGKNSLTFNHSVINKQLHGDNVSIVDFPNNEKVMLMSLSTFGKFISGEWW
jgi:hypothetical protein